MNSIKKISKSFMAKIVAFVGFYLCDIILARGLTIDDYAEWSYFFSITNIMLWISNFGISLTIRTIVAKLEDINKRKYYINCGIILRFLVSLVFTFVLLALSRNIAIVSGWPEQYPDLIFLIRAGCALPLFMAFTELWKGVFIGTSELNFLLYMAFLEHIGYAFGCLIGVLVVGNVKGALLGYYFGYIVSTIIGSLLLKVSIIGFKLSEEVRADILDIFKRAIPFVITCIITFAILEMDTVMIGAFKVGNAELANYNVAKKLIQKAISVNEAFLYAVLPRFAIINRNNYEESKSSFRKIGNVNLLITVCVGCGIAVILTAIVPIIYGNDYLDTSKYILLLLPAYLSNGITQFYMNFLYYREKARVVSYCYTVSFVINLVMNWSLIPRIGAVGAAAGTVISLVPFAFMLAIFSKREWKFVKRKCEGE